MTPEDNTPPTSKYASVIEEWITANNAHDADGYLSYFTQDPTIDDPSVGAVFAHREGVSDYFETYVVGYNTQTRILRITPTPTHTHVEVEFTGDFPEGRINGIFDITFEDNRIAFIRADLVH